MRRFPEGRIGPDDDGELAIAITADRKHKVVRIDFGKPVTWLGLPPAQVRALCQLLLKRADEIDSPTGGADGR